MEKTLVALLENFELVAAQANYAKTACICKRIKMLPTLVHQMKSAIEKINRELKPAMEEKQ